MERETYAKMLLKETRIFQELLKNCHLSPALVQSYQLCSYCSASLASTEADRRVGTRNVKGRVMSNQKVEELVKGLHCLKCEEVIGGQSLTSMKSVAGV